MTAHRTSGEAPTRPSDAPPARRHDPERIAEALLRLSEEAAETRSLRVAAERICRCIAEIVGCDRSALYLWSERRDAIIPVAQHGTPEHLVAKLADRHYRPGDLGFDPEAHESGPVVVSRGRASTPDATRALEEAELFALAFVALPGRPTTDGWLTLGIDGSPGFSDHALAVARRAARHAAPLIDNARLFTKTEKTAVFRAGVAKLAATLNAWNDGAVVARIICKRGAELFDVDSGLLLRREGEALVPVATHGPIGERAAAVTLALADEHVPIVRAFRDARPVFVNDFGKDGRPSLVSDLGLRCLVAVPLVGRDGTADRKSVV